MKYNNNKVIEDVIEQLASRLSDTFDAFNHKFLKICIERYASLDYITTPKGIGIAYNIQESINKADILNDFNTLQ